MLRLLLLCLGICLAEGRRVQRSPLAMVMNGNRHHTSGARPDRTAVHGARRTCEATQASDERAECEAADEYRGDEHSAADAIGSMCAGACAAYHS